MALKAKLILNRESIKIGYVHRSMKIEFKRLGYIVLFARDLNRSKLFYTRMLGLKVRHEAEHYVEFDLEGTRFSLYDIQEMRKVVKDLRDDDYSLNSSSHPARVDDKFELVFQTENIQETVEELKKKGVQFLQDPIRQSWGEITVYFRDPDDNLIELAQKSLK